MHLIQFSSRGQKRNIIQLEWWHKALCTCLFFQICGTDLVYSRIDSFNRCPSVSYHKPSQYIWTQIWPQIASTFHLQRTRQKAERRTSLPDETRQVVSCQSQSPCKHLLGCKYEVNQACLTLLIRVWTANSFSKQTHSKHWSSFIPLKLGIYQAAAVY